MEYLPFTPKTVHTHGSDLMECGLFRTLPEEYKKFISKTENQHVLSYMHMIPLEKIGVPTFYSTLTRDLRKLNHPNLLYPVGNGISIHVFPDEEDIRDYYIPVEPILFQEIDDLLLEVEELLVDLVNMLEIKTDDLDERKKLLEEVLKRICVIKDGEKQGTKLGFLSRLLGKLKNILKTKKYRVVNVTSEEYRAIRYLILRDKVGMGVLESLLLDPYIEDITCSGLGQIFVEHKIFSGLKTTISFKEISDLDSFVIRLSEKIGKPITYRNPIVDATLPDGSRINIVFGEDISRRGSNFTIRKFAGTPMSILELLELGTLDYTIAAYLWILIKEGMNCFVAGETASGKTTTLNAITTFLPPDGKVVSIEDTPELQVPLKNWTREATRSSRDDSGSEVSMFDLLKAALRQRPNEIIIGEIRGVEGNIAFQAMQTGHPVMSTFHAASVEKLIQRLTGDPINVPRAYIDNLNLVICQNAVHLPEKGMLRRVTSINEIVGYDPLSQSYTFIEVFRWEPSTDTFSFTGNLNSYLLENKIAPKWGIPDNERRKVYTELQKREKILRKLHKAGIKGFHELFSMIVRLGEEGLTK
ncbi:type II/IV secretion system ATPase subunit [Methanosarcina sp. 1.H.A.2.2]|uniref:type II/IV secretion system ATPase subunit n=1 Tax=Methanosarcina sp. 1.H.A.2.2 TaxID=1483601 RepID=UPI0006222135|nr:type II/IV secretion system ATPase subunit [Methanosarcina sp. 1.H.A.2.2]KKH45838.1 secretion system protein E [Methanosarcina sp. 1.H.A.2.2]